MTKRFIIVLVVAVCTLNGCDRSKSSGQRVVGHTNGTVSVVNYGSAGDKLAFVVFEIVSSENASQVRFQPDGDPRPTLRAPDGTVIDLRKSSGGYQYRGTNFSKFDFDFSKGELDRFLQSRDELSVERLRDLFKRSNPRE